MKTNRLDKEFDEESEFLNSVALMFIYAKIKDSVLLMEIFNEEIEKDQRNKV